MNGQIIKSFHMNVLLCVHDVISELQVLEMDFSALLHKSSLISCHYVKTCLSVTIFYDHTTF